MTKLLKFCRGKTLGLTILCIFAVLIGSIVDLIQPIFLMLIIDCIGDWVPGLPFDGWNTFWLFCGLMLAFAFLSLFFGILSSYWGSKASLLMAMNIRQGMFNKIQSLSFSDIDKVTPSSIITRMTNDVQKFQVTFQMILTMLFKVPIMLIGGLVLAFLLVNWEYGVIAIGLVVILSLIISLISWKVIPLFEKGQKKLDSTNSVMRENVLGMRVVKAFNIQNEQFQRFDSENKELRNIWVKAQKLSVLYMPITQFLFQAAIDLVLIVSGIQLATGSINIDTVQFIGEIFMFTQLLSLVLGATVIGLMVILNIVRSYASVIRINAIFALVPSIAEPSSPIALPKNPKIEFKNVDFKYDMNSEEYSLKNINLTINNGETLGIIGGTGAGKSTLVNLIPRLYDVTSGEVTIGDVNVKNISSLELKSKVGMVLQENILFSGTIEDNLRFGNQNATEKDLDWACKNACASEFINGLPKKYKSVVEQRGRNFSGGQKQRLSIARTLVMKPEILILDDTTSALDMLTEAKLQKNIKTNLKNTTVIIVAQRVSAVKDANKIIVMDKGRIVDCGTHEELIKSSKIYRSIVESQLGKEGLK